jgi:hypothetical protein
MGYRWDHRSLAINRILPGDIIGTTPENVRGAVVESFQAWCQNASASANRHQVFQADIVHVAISLGGDAMVEAVPRHGVKAASLYDYNRPFVVFRPSWSDRSHPDLVCRHARRSIGASYTTPLQLLTKLLPRWQSRIGGNAPHIGTDILICSTFVVQIFDDAWPRTVRSTASALLPGFPCSCLQTWWRRQASSRSHPDPFQPETLRAFLRG